MAASAITALSAFVIQWAVGRFSSAEVTAEFLVYWALLFAIFGVVGGVRNETTRAVGAARSLAAADRSSRAVTAALLLGGVSALLVTASAPLWSERLAPSTSPGIIPVVGLAALSYACHVTLLGALAGTESWRRFSALMIAESLVRLLLVATVLLTAGGLMALELAVAASALTWLLLSGSSAFRRALTARTDVPLGTLLRNHLYVIVSSMASAALVVGFPVLMQLTSREADATILASTIFAITLTRSPIMIPLQAFQGYAIVAFLRAGRNQLAALIRPLVILSACALVAAVAAALLGPWLMEVLFAGRYEVTSGTFAGLMAAAATLAMLTLTGTAALARSAHLGYTAGWVVAAAVAAGLLWLPLPLPERTVIALVAGPLAGLAVHLLSVVRGPGRIQTPSE